METLIIAVVVVACVAMLVSTIAELRRPPVPQRVKNRSKNDERRGS